MKPSPARNSQRMLSTSQAYIIGTGLAGPDRRLLSGARRADAGRAMIHILEKRSAFRAAPATDTDYPGLGYVMRGGREMDNHFEVMWDLFRAIPSIEDRSGSACWTTYYWLEQARPQLLADAARRRTAAGSAHTDNKFGLSDEAAKEIMRLFFTPDEALYDKRINEFFDDEVFESNFSMYWRTMFAFENWHSALEVKRYIQRYIHHVGGLPDFSALRFTRYNQYESMILPMVNYLRPTVSTSSSIPM